MIQVAAAVLRNEGGHILLCQRGEDGHCAGLWEFPGGKRQEGESLSRCAVRECKEELGVDVTLTKQLWHTTYQYPDRQVQLTFFEGTIKSGIPNVRVHRRMEWVPPEALGNYPVCPANQPLIDQLKGGDYMEVLFVCYPKCTTCQKAKKWLDDHRISYRERHIKDDRPTAAELAEWHQKSGLPLKRFFNTSGMVYQSLGLKDKLPAMEEQEQLTLLATDGMLVKRPIVVGDTFAIPGFRAVQWARAFGIDEE